MRRLAILPAVAALFLAGCAGYHLGQVKPSYLKNVNNIAVPSFKNDTLLPRLEVPTANAVISQIQQDGTYKVVRENEADAILEGTIKSIDRQPARVLIGSVLTTTEFNLQLRIDYTLVDRRTGKELMRSSAIGETSFFVGGDLQQDEQQAIPLAAEKAAVQIVSKLSEGW
jgi:hypothetical protein